ALAFGSVPWGKPPCFPHEPPSYNPTWENLPVPPRLLPTLMGQGLAHEPPRQGMGRPLDRLHPLGLDLPRDRAGRGDDSAAVRGRRTLRPRRPADGGLRRVAAWSRRPARDAHPARLDRARRHAAAGRECDPV